MHIVVDEKAVATLPYERPRAAGPPDVSPRPLHTCPAGEVLAFPTKIPQSLHYY
jgi:hypothetical protein